MLYVWLVQPWPLIFQSMLWMKCSQSMKIKIIFSPDLKILVCRHPTESTGNVRVKQLFSRSFLKKFFFNHKYFVLAKFSLESKVNFLFFLLHHFFNCSYSFVHIVHTVLCTGFTRLHYTNVQNVQMYTLCLKWKWFLVKIH